MASELLSKSRRWIRLVKSRAVACWSMLTSDFNYSKDYFFGWKFLLTFTGVRFNSNNARIRRWWNLCRVMYSVPFLVTGLNATLKIINRAKLGEICVNTQAIVFATITLLRMMFVVRSYESVQAVRRYVDERQFGRNLDASLRIRGKAFYYVRRIVITLWIILLGVVLSCLLIDLSNHVLAWPSTTRNQITILLEKLIAVITVGGLSMAVFGIVTIVMILSGLRAELKIIAELFGTMLERANNRTQLSLESTPGNSEQLQQETKRYFWKYVQEEFSDCIKLHQEFLTNLATVRPFLNATFLVVYYTTALSIACGSFFILYSKTISLVLVHSWCLTGVLSLECAYYTRAVTLLTEVNESIGEQVYNLDWPTQLEFDPEFAEEYRSVRLTMLTVMAISQQPLRINCFGFFEFTQERFTELVMMSYNLVSFFRNFI